ncbi:hypothetical protein FOZ62_014236, partial [Perkinsus olseni]
MSDEAGSVKLHVGWEIEKMTESIETTHQNIQSLKTKIAGVVGGLSQIRLAVSLAIPPAGDRKDGFKKLDAEVARRRLEQLRKDIADYKAQVYELAETSDDKKRLRGGLRRKTAVDDKTKPLFERLGGAADIGSAVDLVYDKALADPRTRAYFDKAQKKMNQIRE